MVLSPITNNLDNKVNFQILIEPILLIESHDRNITTLLPKSSIT